MVVPLTRGISSSRSSRRRWRRRLTRWLRTLLEGQDSDPVLTEMLVPELVVRDSGAVDLRKPAAATQPKLRATQAPTVAGPGYSKYRGRGLHVPGYNYCGPLTQLEGQAPVNRLDDACRAHDYAYSRAQSRQDYKNANEELAHLASEESGAVARLVEGFFTLWPAFPYLSADEQVSHHQEL